MHSIRNSTFKNCLSSDRRTWYDICNLDILNNNKTANKGCVPTWSLGGGLTTAHCEKTALQHSIQDTTYSDLGVTSREAENLPVT